MPKKRLGCGLFSFLPISSGSGRSSKRGQITVFIILGILMLLALVLVIALKSEIFAFKTDEIAPTEKGKVENYIVACMDRLGEEALFKIGLQSGYIEVPTQIAKDNQQSLRLSPMNVVPYWAVGPNIFVPSLQEIKERIDLYMEENMRDCLFSTQAFTEQYDLIEKSEITADTNIAENQVIFNIRWDIEVNNKAGEVVSEVINHITESPVKLKKVYTMAVKILENEMQSLKVEDITQDLIALEHPKVPVAGIELRCSKKTWDVKEAESTLLKMLRINIRELKIKGTDFLEFPEELPYYDNHYVWDIGEDISERKVSVMFNFDETYPHVFAVTPLSGTKMASSQLGGTDQISFLCIQTWKFTYDLVYPVLVRVRDETTNYEFNMAFTVHLIQNTPNKGDPVARASLQFPTINADGYCTSANVPMSIKTYELVENGEGVSYNEDLGDVNLSFTCLRYKCDLGQSKYDYAGLGFSGISLNVPYCVGGILRGTKPGYKESWQRVVTTAGKEAELSLTPVINIPLNKIKVVKHDFTEVNGVKNIGPAQEGAVEETTLIKLKFIKSNLTETNLEHEATVAVSKQMDKKIFEEEKLELLAKADFTYYLEVMVFREEEFIGGYKGEVTLPWSQLKDASQLIFHILSSKTTNEEEMFAFMTNIEELSKEIPALEIK